MAKLDSPIVVIPSDTTDLAVTAEAIFVGGAGNLVVYFAGAIGVPITLTGVAAGTLLNFRISRILLTGTTATNIVSIS